MKAGIPGQASLAGRSPEATAISTRPTPPSPAIEHPVVNVVALLAPDSTESW